MNNTADLIKSRISISEFIGKSVPLKAKGNGEFVGLCPFHAEKTPSFTVSEAKSFYHCFGCGEGGDIFTFLMKLEHIEYPEALKRLAELAGVALVQRSSKERDQIEITYKIYQAAQTFYQNQLIAQNNVSRETFRYLNSRGLDNDMISKFGIGLSPNYSALASNISTQFDEKALLASKILNKKNGLYDIFAHRIIFPIHDRRGRVIAFGGRLLPHLKSDGPKYLNSPENPIFKKSYNLYGLFQGAQAIIKQKQAIVVEGYLDVISLHQFGICNTVAPLGTSLKLEHLNILSKLCSEVIVCLDGDEAGYRAMMRFIDIILPDLEPNLRIKFIALPSKQDPDEYVRKYGKEAFMDLVFHASNLVDFLFRNIYQKHQINTPEGSAAFKIELEKQSARIKNSHLSKEYKYYLTKKFWESVKNEKNSLHSNAASLHNVKEVDKASPFVELVALIIAYPKLISKDEILKVLIDAELENKNVDKLRCYLIEWKDYISDSDNSNDHLHVQLCDFLQKKGCVLGDLRFFISRFKSTSLDYYTDLAKNILQKHQLQLVSLDIEMLKKKLGVSENADDFARYSSLISLKNKLKNQT